MLFHIGKEALLKENKVKQVKCWSGGYGTAVNSNERW
jgi:hypothetical protein